MSSRWAVLARCTLIAASALLVTAGMGGGGAWGAAPVTDATAGPVAPALILTSQTPWVTPDAPWFNIGLGVSGTAGPASGLHVTLTFSARIDNASQLQEAVSGTPTTDTLLRLSEPVATTASGPGASVCVTVVPNTHASTPATGAGACAGANTDVLSLGCQPGTGICGDVYPVSVALVRNADSATLARFTTFLTYQEPQAIGKGGPLRVGVVVPAKGGEAGVSATASALSDHHDVAVTLAVSPTATVAAGRAARRRTGPGPARRPQR